MIRRSSVEMYPQLMAFTNGGTTKRDHNHNGMCEWFYLHGTWEGAAAWESGMDNAIRFDDAGC